MRKIAFVLGFDELRADVESGAIDTVVVLSDRPLTPAEASDEGRLMTRGLKGELVAVALRFDERRGSLRRLGGLAGPIDRCRR